MKRKATISGFTKGETETKVIIRHLITPPYRGLSQALRASITLLEFILNLPWCYIRPFVDFTELKKHVIKKEFDIEESIMHYVPLCEYIKEKNRKNCVGCPFSPEFGRTCNLHYDHNKVKNALSCGNKAAFDYFLMNLITRFNMACADRVILHKGSGKKFPLSDSSMEQLRGRARREKSESTVIEGELKKEDKKKMEKQLIEFEPEDVKLITPPYADLEEALRASANLLLLIQRLPWAYVKLFRQSTYLANAVIKDVLKIRRFMLNSSPLCEYFNRLCAKCPFVGACENKEGLYSRVSSALKRGRYDEFMTHTGLSIARLMEACNEEQEKKARCALTKPVVDNDVTELFTDKTRALDDAAFFNEEVIVLGSGRIAKIVRDDGGVKALLASIKLWKCMVSLPDKVFIEALAGLTLEEASRPDHFILLIKTAAMKELGMSPVLYMCPLCECHELTSACPLSDQAKTRDCSRSCVRVYDYGELHKGPKNVYSTYVRKVEEGSTIVLRKDDWSTYRMAIMSFLNRLKYHYYEAVLGLIGLENLKI